MVVSVRVCVQWKGVFTFNICVFKNWTAKKNVTQTLCVNDPVEKEIHFTVHIERRQEPKKNSRSLSPSPSNLPGMNGDEPFNGQITYSTHSAH